MQEIELSPHKNDYGAEIAVGPTKQHVYASSRGSGIMIVYKLTTDNRLVKIQQFYLAGTWPRHFVIHDYIMLVADQKGASLQALVIDKMTGKLEAGSMVSTLPNPAFVCIVKNY